MSTLIFYAQMNGSARKNLSTLNKLFRQGQENRLREALLLRAECLAKSKDQSKPA